MNNVSFQSLHLMIISLPPFYLVFIIKSITSPILCVYNSKINNSILSPYIATSTEIIYSIYLAQNAKDDG